MINIKEQVKEAKKANRPYFHKNFFTEVPSWTEFLTCIFQEVQIPNEELAKHMVYGTDVEEKLIGNVIVTNDVYYSPQTGDLKKYFPRMNELIEEFKNVNKIELALGGAKISVGPRYVAPHHDNWDAFTVQCQGTTIWTISHEESGYKEQFFMSPGDILFFPKETKHELYCEEPRAGMIFNLPPDDRLLN